VTRNKSLANRTDHTQDLAGLPPWMAGMRKAAMESITEADVKQIMQAQVELAKKGNAGALKFVTEFVLGGSALKGATFIQNNTYGGDPPEKPTEAKPGTNGKLLKMQRRAAARMPLTDPEDGPDVDLE
jgi:hypothetical protein